MNERSWFSWILSAISVVVIALSLVQLFAAPAKTGITFDEPVHGLRAKAWLDNGWYVPDLLMTDGDPGKGAASPYVYGPAFSATAHAANRILGHEAPKDIANTQAAWDTRRLTSAVLAIAGVLAASLAVWAITGSRLFALWAGAALFAIPLWTGMGFFNPKDTPAAAGYTMFTAGLVLALVRGQGRPPPWRAVAIVALLASGYFFGAGTRLALWLPLTASLGVFVVAAWARVRFAGESRDPVTWGAVALGFAIGVLTTILIYPKVFEKPFTFVQETLTASSDFNWAGYTLTAGKLLTEDAPWWYLPAWLVASVPTLILGLALLGVVFGLLNRRGREDTTPRLRSLLGRLDFGVVIVMFQAVPLALGSVLLSSVMYTGLRQHLYVVPALAILAGVGGFQLWRRTGAGGRPRWQKTAATALLSLALIVPAVEGGLLFPYNYTYVSPVAGIGGVNGRWETDFWWASQREGVDNTPDDVDPYCSGQTDGDFTYTGSASYVRCSSLTFPYLVKDGTMRPPGARPWVIARLRSGGKLGPACRSVADVTRWLRGERVVMSYVARCDRSEIRGE